MTETMNGSKPPVSKSEEELARERVLAELDRLGGLVVGEDSLIFEGTKFILPKSMEDAIEDAVEYLQDWDQQQNTEFSFTRTFPYKPYDGAAAFERAMKRVFGTTGIGQRTFSMFGSRPPSYQTINVGPGQTMQVPWGNVSFSPLKATFTLGAGRTSDGYVFELEVEAPRRHRRRVEAFFKVVEDELVRHSLYKGKAIQGAGELQPEFVDLAKFDRSRMIFKQEVTTQLETNIWAPLRYTQAHRDNGVTLKRAVLIEGPNGTGKSLSGQRTAELATENGWTYILVRVGESPLQALKTAAMYAPAVVFIEDMDTFASAEGRSRVELSKVLDALDSVNTKNKEVMAVFTTNFPEKLDKGVVRAGRIDAVIHVAELDRPGYEALVKAYVPARLLSQEVDWDKVAESYTDEHGNPMLPSFAAEAATLAVRFSIARNHGRPALITTQDLVDAAYSKRDHLRLMADAQHGDNNRPALETAMGAAVVEAFKREGHGHVTIDSEGRWLDLDFVDKPSDL